MSQTLLYLDQVIAGFPDNASKLIEPVNVRDFAVSILVGVGFLEETENTAVPISDGVWTLINPLLPSPIVSEQTLWQFDANHLIHSQYSILVNTVVPSGYTKLCSLVAVLELSKSAAGADNYQVSYTKNGATFGEGESIEYDAAGTQTLTLLHSFQADISIETDVYGVQIQGVGTNDDLVLGYFTMQVRDSVLIQDPNAP